MAKEKKVKTSKIKRRFILGDKAEAFSDPFTGITIVKGFIGVLSIGMPGTSKLLEQALAGGHKTKLPPNRTGELERIKESKADKKSKAQLTDGDVDEDADEEDEEDEEEGEENEEDEDEPFDYKGTSKDVLLELINDNDEIPDHEKEGLSLKSKKDELIELHKKYA